MQLLCRNRVADFETWWTVFETHAAAHREAGLHLEHLWLSADDQNEVFFLFNVDSRFVAEAFMNAPEADEGAIESGVIDGDFHFIEEAVRY